MESPVSEFATIYVPRDEEFEQAKQEALDIGKLKGTVRNIIHALSTITADRNVKGYSDINGLYTDSSSLQSKTQPGTQILNKVQEFLKFDPPKVNSSEQILHILIIKLVNCKEIEHYDETMKLIV